MKPVSTASRVSLALSCLTITVFLGAQSLGLVPDTFAAALQARKELCESIAVYSSLAAQRGDVSGIKNAATSICSRNPDIVSMAVRTADGQLLAEVGDHEAHWKQAPRDRSTASHVQVPIFRNDARWGSVEICFKPLARSGIFGFMGHPVVKLTGFVAGTGFGLYLLYLRRTLRYLDPAAVIPERVKLMLDTLVEPLLVLDAKERIVLANQAFADTLGQPAEKLLGVKASEFPWKKPQSQEPAAEAPWSQSLGKGTTQKGVELGLSVGKADRRAFIVNCAPIVAGDGQTRGALATFDDVTSIEEKNAQLRETLELLRRSRDEINQKNQELQALANTDALTKCYNRRAFFDQFESHWDSSRRYAHPVSCLMVDLDHFKKINDQHGHLVGDQVLRQVAQLLRALARASDVVGRYGGEEFCIVMPHVSAEGAQRAAERFRQAIASTPVSGLSVTASFGVSSAELGAADPQQMLDQADRALYVAKRQGRNRVVLWSRTLADAPGAQTHSPAAELPAASAPDSPIPFHAVSALMSALRHRDRETAAHSQRVADLCVATARGIMTARDCYVLEVAALLHDIGKLGVPDAILLKPGPLTEEEWKVMRAHDRMGADIIAAAFASVEVSDIIRTHHARYAARGADGAPPVHRDIPLGARILSIADAFDAMVSDRVYRKGRSREDAFAELRRCAGSQFDPELVERFIEVANVLKGQTADAPARTAEQEALALGADIERLAGALDAKDLSAVALTAGRMAATASKDGLPQVAKLAAQVATAADEQHELNEILQLTQDLLGLCRSSANFAPAARPGQGAPTPSR